MDPARPRPYESGSGLPPKRFKVRWELAHDERFTRVTKRGTVDAHPEYNHAVHVEVGGLDADRVLYYRFRVGQWVSPVGRTRTAPSKGARLTELRLAAVSCQAYHDGYFTAYRHLADEDLDAVFHLGDYLYEYAVTAAGAPAPTPTAFCPRSSTGRPSRWRTTGSGTPSTSPTPI